MTLQVDDFFIETILMHVYETFFFRYWL